jgi:hypothetical protein
MSWEAYRWTAKTPSELYQTLGPHGVDHLVRQMLDACWREHPMETRTLAGVRRAAQEVFDRNMAVWGRIKKPSPAAFFEDLLPNAADGFLRQAMVLCWMMLPRAGGRDVKDVRRIVGEIFNRNLAAWSEDEATFTGKSARKSTPKSIRAARKTAPVKKPKHRSRKVAAKRT